MKANDVRTKYLEFFKARGHAVIPAAPLVPQNDPTTLFTSSGMQPLVPYLKGETHPMGKRLTDSQPSFRAEDIDEVGDNRHTTFFEMLGNWSLGDYFKKEQLPWFYEFLTQVIGLPSEKLFVTVFGGDNLVPKDEEAIQIWQGLFNTDRDAQEGEKGFDPAVKIYTYGPKKNWWSRSGTPDKMPPGEIGGPDSEVFYDFGEAYGFHEKSGIATPCHVNCDCGRFLEIGNSVFMQYEKQTDGSFQPLPQKNVDFGGGLERIVAVAKHEPDMFKTDLFWPIIEKIENLTGKKYDQGHEIPIRVVTDHMKASVFMIAEGIEPSNKLQGYVLRRYLRRAAVKMRNLCDNQIPTQAFTDVAEAVVGIYEGVYFEKSKILPLVRTIIETEMSKFAKTLDRGLKEIANTPIETIDAKFAFNLFQTYGFPFEVTQELLMQKGKTLDKEAFEAEFKRHQEMSRTAAKGMFKGGLADHSADITKLHTATHLLQQALRQVLGSHVQQIGSNITAERLRFDFTHSEKLTDEQMKQVEDIVNQQISRDLPITMEIMDLQTALNQGALAFFGERYGEKVKVYSIGDFSKEVCGGPHVEHTGLLGTFSLGKQESVGAGKKRIYGYLK